MCNLDTLLQAGRCEILSRYARKRQKVSQLIWILTARVEFKIPYKRIRLWNAEKLGAHDTEVYHLSCITITSGQPWPKLFWSGGQMNNGLLKWKICPRGDAGLSFIAAISVCRPPGRGERFIIMQNFMDFQFWRIKRVHNLAVRQAVSPVCPRYIKHSQKLPKALPQNGLQTRLLDWCR